MSEIKIIKRELSSKATAKIAIVVSRFNSFVVDRLYDGAIRTLRNHGNDDASITVIHVPGAFEIPLAVKTCLDQKRFDAIITLGAIIRGETPHFEYISSECTRGIGQLGLETGIPVIFGVLTVDDAEQAMDRAGADESNKGAEAALAALEMISVLEQVRS